MADRILTWHLPTLLSTTEAQGPTFYMEKDYSPDHCRFYARIAPSSGDAKVDIRKDGVTIFTAQQAVLTQGDNLEEEAEDYSGEPTLEKGSLVSLHVAETNGAADITVQLELDAIDVEDDTE